MVAASSDLELPRAIVENLEKLAFLRTAGVEDWPLEPLNPNRLKFLAHLTRKSSAQALQRAPGTRRYPMLVAFLSQALTEVTDEVIEMFDRCLAEAYTALNQHLCYQGQSSAVTVREGNHDR